MSDIFHRLNPFRLPSPTKPTFSIRKQTKSPNLTIDRPDSTLPARASSSLESPNVPYGRYIFDTQQSIELDRPVFTPLPLSPTSDSHTATVSPGRRAKTPSILRTLAHHPSLSALKGTKQKKGKKADEVDIRYERLSGSVDDEVPVHEVDTDDRKGWMSTWGSAKKRRARKGSLKLVKSLPSVRFSDEVQEYPPSPIIPVPAIPEKYTLRLNDISAFGKTSNTGIEVQLDDLQAPSSPTRSMCVPYVAPSPTLRSRAQSVSLSPSRHIISPRHLSAPSRVEDVSPLILDYPCIAEPLPIPSWDERKTEDDKEYDSTQYGDLARTPDKVVDLDDGLELLRPTEALPHGTPGGSKEDKRKGILSDVAKHEKGSIRYFSRDTYTRLSQSPSGSPRSRPSPISIPPNSAVMRSESPFEVKLSPAVARRMSLEAFGPTPLSAALAAAEERGSMISITESMEEMDDDPFESDNDDQFELDNVDSPTDLDDGNTLDGWKGTQLTTIDESPSSVRNASLRYPSTPTSATRSTTSSSAFHTPDRRHQPSTPTTPTSPIRRLAEARAEHIRALDTQVRESTSTIGGLRQEIDRLTGSIKDETTENDVAWKVIDALQSELKLAVNHAEARVYALDQMRLAMTENEAFFDSVQNSHNQLEERCERMEIALDHHTEMRDQQADRIDALTRSNEDVIARLENDKSILTCQLQNSTIQLEIKTEDVEDAARQMDVTVAYYNARIAVYEEKVSELERLKLVLSLRESEVEALNSEIMELRDEIKACESGSADKDVLLQLLRDKIGSKQFEIDEGRIKAEGEAREMEARIEVLEGEKTDLVRQLDQLASNHSDHTLQLENDNQQLETKVGDLRQDLEEMSGHLEAARSDLEPRDCDASLQQGEVEVLRAELDAANESVIRLESHSARLQRENDRISSDNKWQIDTLKFQLVEQKTVLQTALDDREMSSTTTADVKSRLSAYLPEIDRLKVSEAKLLSENKDLRASSSSETLRVAELEKRVRELEEDKELLDLSLDNKDTEITLLQRQASRSGSVTPGPGGRRLGTSTSRIPSTPTISRAGETTGDGKRLSISMSAGGLKRPTSAAGSVGSTSARRETSVLSTPKPAPTPIIRRSSGITTPTPSSRAVLGSATKHNRTVSKFAIPRKPVAGSEVSSQLKRQTSMPSIKRDSSVSRSGNRTLDGMAEVDEQTAN